MRVRVIYLGMLAAAGIGAVTAGSAVGQDTKRIWCEPIPPNRAAGFPLDLAKYPDGICPIGFIAVVASAPGLLPRPVSASGD